MLFKPKQISKDYTFILKDVIYSLEYPTIKFTQQYETMAPILKSWINDEWHIISANLGIPIQNRVLVQFAKIVIRHIAKPEYREYLRKVSQDPNGFTTFSRFMDIIGMIHIACEPKFLDILRIRFLKSHIDDVYGKMYNGEEPELLPTAEDWISCMEEFPWVWIIPHIQVLFYGDSNIQTQFNVLYQQQLRP